MMNLQFFTRNYLVNGALAFGVIGNLGAVSTTAALIDLFFYCFPLFQGHY